MLMMPHLRKVFENLVKLEFDSDEITATAMVSAEGEQVALKNCVIRGGEVEEWVFLYYLSDENSRRINEVFTQNINQNFINSV